jgi:hypothetical protein
MRLIWLVSDRNSLYIHTRPLFHKALELGYQWNTPAAPGGGIDASLRFNTRGDHAGLKCWLDLGKLLIEFSVNDHRHWNMASKSWMSDLDYLPSPCEDELGEEGDLPIEGDEYEEYEENEGE